jgi:hypothetical protein
MSEYFCREAHHEDITERVKRARKNAPRASRLVVKCSEGHTNIIGESSNHPMPIVESCEPK